MINVQYVCNGCGLYTSYAGKSERQLNVIEVDLTNYMLFTSGFKMQCPRVKAHFCDGCYLKIMDGIMRVAALGETETMRKTIESLQSKLNDTDSAFREYRTNVARLLREVT